MDVTIDKNLLDEELMKLPNELLEACEKTSEACYALANAKKERDELKARLDFNIRNMALATGRKTTEASIANEITLDPELDKLTTAVYKAEKVYYDAMGLCDALRKKRDCLSDLVKLYLSGYWSAVPGTTTVATTTSKEAQNEMILAELNK